MAQSKQSLSVIIPFFNEEKNLVKLHREVIAVLIKLPIQSDVIYVNDGSVDKSEEELKKVIKSNQKIKIKILKLRRNFGQTPATMAGIENSNGKVVAFLDADLQNDPRDLPKLLQMLTGDTEMVVGWRKIRKDSPLHNFGTWLINSIINRLFAVPLHDTGCSLKVIKRSALSDLRLYGEFHRLLPIMLFWRGVKLKEVVITHRPRVAGKSKYNYFKIVRFFLDILTIKFLDNYGTRPAYIFGTIGIISCGLAFIPLFITAYEKLFYDIFVHRNPLFMIFIFLFLIGVQFIFMGLIGELLVRIYYESQNKKTYELVK